jgi:hypothetical protein
MENFIDPTDQEPIRFWACDGTTLFVNNKKIKHKAPNTVNTENNKINRTEGDKVITDSLTNDSSKNGNEIFRLGVEFLTEEYISRLDNLTLLEGIKPKDLLEQDPEKIDRIDYTYYLQNRHSLQPLLGKGSGQEAGTKKHPL